MTLNAGTSLAERAGRVAAVAAAHADEVDASARFPREAVDAMIAERLLSVQVPVELGGEAASLSEIAEACSLIGQACAAAAMVFAMHHIKLSSLVSHGAESGWHRAFMRRIASEQLLLASATTEGGIGGNLRNSICAIEVEGGRCRLAKDATVISYGAHADAILITSRAHAEAASSDQVMTVFTKDQYTLERTHVWDTLGMRGTCSDGWLFKGEAPKALILPKPFAEIAAQSMLATSHLLWSAVWYGIAVNAVSRAQAFVRAAARKSPGVAPPGALRLAEASNLLQLVKSNTIAGLKEYETAKADLKASIARRLAAAEDQIASAEAAAVREVRDRAVNVAVAAAGDLIAAKMTAAEKNRLIDAAIGEVETRLH